MLKHPRTFACEPAARRSLRITSVALAVAMLSPPALSATRTWDGGAGSSDPFWDLVANWNSGLPLAFDIANLGAFNTTVRADGEGALWRLQSLSGTGTLTIDGGRLSYEAASSVGGLVFNVGSLGGKGTLTTNSLVWTRGNLGHAESLNGTVNVNGTSTLLASSGRAIDFGQALNLKGNANWSGFGIVEIYGAGGSDGGASRASSLTVFAGKTLSLAGTGSNESTGYFLEGFGTFNNRGTITKTGTNALSINSIFDNTGTLNVNGGETRFGGTRTLGGTVNVASGATLRFDGQTTFDPAAIVGGAGNLIFEGVSSVVASGTRTFGGAGTKTLALGNLGGAGTMVFNRLNYAGGTMGWAEAPGGTTIVNGTTSVTTSVATVGFGRTLKLNGDASWAGRGSLNILGAGTTPGGLVHGASVVNLAAGKTFSLTSDLDFQQIQGAGTFMNSGTLAKAGANTLYIDSLFNNIGTVVTNQGTIRIGSSAFNNTGTLHANGGRIEVLAAPFLTQWNATSRTLTAGTYRVTGTQPIVFDLGLVSGTSTPNVIKTNKAQIYLEGAGAAILSSIPEPDDNALKALSTNQGVLSLTGGATLGVTGNLANKVAGSVIVGSGSTLTLGGGSGVYEQFDTASTFVGGTLTATKMIFNGGSLSAGNGAGLVGIGVLNASVGDVTFSAASRYDQDVTTAGWDRLSVATGNVVLDGTLQATFGAGASIGTRRFLTTEGSMLGTFDSVVSNLDTSLYKVSAVYGAQFVNLKVTAVPALGSVMQAVPEPQTVALMVAGLAMLGWKLRRRQGARSAR